MPTPLFDENGRYTDAGNALDAQVSRLLQGFFSNEEYSTREVLAVITSAAVGEMCGAQIDRQIRFRQARKAQLAEVVDVQDE